MQNILSFIKELLVGLLLSARRSLGFGGHQYITSGYTPVGNENYYHFKVLADASVTYVNKYGGADQTNKALLAGDEVYGFFTTLTVASGEIRAYLI